MGEGYSLIQDGAKKEVRRYIHTLIEQKGGRVDAYKEVLRITCEYLRQMLGFMISNLVMERISYITHQRFSFFELPITKDGLDLEMLEDSDQNIEALRFCIDCAIDLMERLGGDTLIKGLIRRLNHVGKENEII